MKLCSSEISVSEISVSEIRVSEIRVMQGVDVCTARSIEIVPRGGPPFLVDLGLYVDEF